jgi:prophage regulatory protein
MSNHFEEPSNNMNDHKHEMKERFLRLPEVKLRTGLRRSTIYEEISKGVFPRPVSLGMRCVGWLESEIESWIMARIQKRRH